MKLQGVYNFMSHRVGALQISIIIIKATGPSVINESPLTP